MTRSVAGAALPRSAVCVTVGNRPAARAPSAPRTDESTTQEVHSMSTATTVPFGVRYLVSPPPSTDEAPVITYSEGLQLNVWAEGNPWHAITAEMPETQTETSNGDGSGPGSDSGTDLY
ncbi:putative ATP-grasp-modified RiPP [Streptomyces sp. NPDC048290]|uniref:putative ATP-grasp-modified RiPP n=1 Tax=Streptomyces sp. NPDC048290 TaxID=3155811 RepID=UPI00342EBBBD